MHFHELASHFYDLLIFVRKFQSACNEIEQVKRLTQEKGSKRSDASHGSQGIPALGFPCNDCIVMQVLPQVGHFYEYLSSYLPALVVMWSSLWVP